MKISISAIIFSAKKKKKMFNIAIKSSCVCFFFFFFFSRCEDFNSPLVIFLFVKSLNVSFYLFHIKQILLFETELLYKAEVYISTK